MEEFINKKVHITIIRGEIRHGGIQPITYEGIVAKVEGSMIMLKNTMLSAHGSKIKIGEIAFNTNAITFESIGHY